jgi:hypothetical protein
MRPATLLLRQYLCVSASVCLAPRVRVPARRPAGQTGEESAHSNRALRRSHHAAGPSWHPFAEPIVSHYAVGVWRLARAAARRVRIASLASRLLAQFQPRANHQRAAGGRLSTSESRRHADREEIRPGGGTREHYEDKQEESRSVAARATVNTAASKIVRSSC